MKAPMTPEEKELAILERARQNDLFLVAAVQEKGYRKGWTRIIGCWQSYPEAIAHMKQAEKWLETEYNPTIGSPWKDNPFDPQFEGECAYMVFMKRWGVN